MAKAKSRARRKKPTTHEKPKLAESPKQEILIAVKVPASPNSDTAPARKLLDAIGRRPTPKHRRRR